MKPCLNKRFANREEDCSFVGDTGGQFAAGRPGTSSVSRTQALVQALVSALRLAPATSAHAVVSPTLGSFQAVAGSSSSLNLVPSLSGSHPSHLAGWLMALVDDPLECHRSLFGTSDLKV